MLQHFIYFELFQLSFSTLRLINVNKGNDHNVIWMARRHNENWRSIRFGMQWAQSMICFMNSNDISKEKTKLKNSNNNLYIVGPGTRSIAWKNGKETIILHSNSFFNDFAWMLSCFRIDYFAELARDETKENRHIYANR